MKPISRALIGILSLTAFQSAFAVDVTGPGNHYIRVTRIGVQVKFEDCFRGSKPECLRTIGPRDSYSVQELQSQRATETWEAYGAIAADVVVVAALTYGGVAAGASLSAGNAVNLSSFFDGIGGMILGAPVGAAAGVATVAYVQALNPVEQFKQASTLSNDVIYDRDVKKANVDKFLERLTLVLEKL